MRTGVKKSGHGRHIGNKYSKVKHAIGNKDSFLSPDGLITPNKPQSSMLIENNTSNTTNQQYVPNIKKSFILEKRRRF